MEPSNKRNRSLEILDVAGSLQLQATVFQIDICPWGLFFSFLSLFFQQVKHGLTELLGWARGQARLVGRPSLIRWWARWDGWSGVVAGLV